MLTRILTFTLLFAVSNSFGQTNDSIENSLSSLHDSVKLKTLDNLAYESVSATDISYWGGRLNELATSLNDDYWIALSKHYQARALASQGDLYASMDARHEAIKHFKKLGREDKMARQYLSIGNSYANLAEYDSSFSNYYRAEELARSSKDTIALIGTILNISTVYHEQGKKEDELRYLLESLELAQELGDSSHTGVIVYNLAVYYTELGEIDKSLEQIDLALELYRKTDNIYGIASVYNLLAQHQFDESNIDSALTLLDKSINLYNQLGDSSRIAFIILNQGETLGSAGRDAESIEKLEEAYRMFKKIGEKLYVAIALFGMSASEEHRGDYNAAIQKLEEAIKIAEEIGSLDRVSLWYKDLANVYHLNGNAEMAFQSMSAHAEYSDSLKNLNQQDAIQEMEAKYQNEKSKLEISNLEKEAKLNEAQIERERNQKIITGGGLAVAIVLIILVSFAFVNKRRDNQIIAKQKEEVELQHQELEAKNQEITDSIQYAKRIQMAILPPDKMFKSHLPDSFVLYKPKDVVAGDFYWLSHTDDLVLFAAADCTGHGVPGAMVSVICNNGLNRSVREFGLTDPGQILDKTRELVIREFEKSEEDVKDGMDISICALSKKTGQLAWAGANNPIWIIRSGSSEIEEIKGDKQPIGVYELSKPFTTHSIQLDQGDSLYLFSDGYADQFGGENGKKYKSGKFKKTILEIAGLPMSDQAKALDERFESWRGSIEQIDDVCVIGVKV